jgi:hypothetical protein
VGSHHLVDFVNTNQTRGQFKHVVSEGDDNELRILGPFFDIVGDNGDLFTLVMSYSSV